MKRSGIKIFSKVTACILASATIAMTATACNSGSKSSAGSCTSLTKITFWNAFTGSDATELKTLVHQFNTENNGKYEVDMNIMSADAFAQKLPVSLATNTGPDLMQLSPNDIITYAKKGTIWNIDDIFSSTGLNQSDFADTALSFCKVNGKLYGLPLEVFSNYLYWNKDLFKAAGLDPNTPPKTLTELVNYAIKLTDTSKNQYGFAMPVKGAPAFYAAFIRGNGGDVVDLKSNKSVFNTPENVATVKMLKQLTDAKVSPVNASGVDTDNVMLSGKMGMYINGPWLIPGLKSHNINFGVANVPAGSKCTSAVLDGVMYGVAKSSTGAKKMAAYAFLKYWNSSKVGKEWSQKVGFPPYLKSVINDPDIKANKNISTLAEAIDSGIASPWLLGVPNGSKIDSDILFPLIEQLQNGTKAEDAVKSASNAIDKIISNS